MAEIIRMPRMSDTMEEGVIATWHKKVGDTVKSGDLLAEVETDKATMDLESYQDGTLLYIGVKKGDAVPVNGILAIIGKKDEDYKPLLEVEKNKKSDKDESSSPEEKTNTTEESKTLIKNEENKSETILAKQPLETNNGNRLKASPLAKKIAAEHGIDLIPWKGKGSGDEGRIVKKDLEIFAESAAPQTLAPPKLIQINEEESHEDLPLSQMRKTIAKRLSESKFGAPHFYLNMTINMDKAVEARKSMNEFSPIKISFNDIIIKATALALKLHPKVNSSWLGDKIRTYHHVHIGVAIAVEEGLVVPVVKFSDKKNLSQISAEVKNWAEKAKNKKLQTQDMQGNTFTISNLGMFDIDSFTAIINSPDACILAVGAIVKAPIVENEQIKIAHQMKITLSCDHRVVDGATGSQFLLTLKKLLENPLNMLV